MNKKQYLELCRFEIPDLETNIKDKFKGVMKSSKNGHIKYIMTFNSIKDNDALLMICNFVDTNDLTLSIKPWKSKAGKIKIQFVFT